jgi:hypothetical protein
MLWREKSQKDRLKVYRLVGNCGMSTSRSKRDQCGEEIEMIHLTIGLDCRLEEESHIKRFWILHLAKLISISDQACTDRCPKLSRKLLRAGWRHSLACLTFPGRLSGFDDPKAIRKRSESDPFGKLVQDHLTGCFKSGN